MNKRTVKDIIASIGDIVIIENGKTYVFGQKASKHVVDVFLSQVAKELTQGKPILLNNLLTMQALYSPISGDNNQRSIKSKYGTVRMHIRLSRKIKMKIKGGRL